MSTGRRYQWRSERRKRVKSAQESRAPLGERRERGGGEGGTRTAILIGLEWEEKSGGAIMGGGEAKLVAIAHGERRLEEATDLPGASLGFQCGVACAAAKGKKMSSKLATTPILGK